MTGVIPLFIEMAPLIIIAIGLLYAYFGVVVHYLFLFISGFVAGGFVGFVLGYGSSESVLSGIVGFLLAGFIGGVLFLILQAVLVLAIGYALGHALGLLLGLEPSVQIFFGMIGAFISWRAFVLVLAMSTAAFGGFLVASGSTVWNVVGTGGVGSLSLTYLSVPTLAFIFVTGTIFQLYLYLEGSFMDMREDGQSVTRGKAYSQVGRRSRSILMWTVATIAVMVVGGAVGVMLAGHSDGVFLGLIVGIPAWLYQYYHEGKTEASEATAIRSSARD
ncbi:hypothetical protein [Haloferax sp. DFSO52]|uniref:hypothetical protein n=1 Tax=Haloferax sp. DFSO52 TaxID=3388505 RepID=UPI003A8620B6